MQSDINLPLILTFKETQEFLHIGRNLLLDLIHSGEIPAFMVGNRWRIRKEDLLEFIENQI